jgi:hypothetical protein
LQPVGRDYFGQHFVETIVLHKSVHPAAIRPPITAFASAPLRTRTVFVLSVSFRCFPCCIESKSFI